jgi:hypothetical protein
MSVGYFIGMMIVVFPFTGVVMFIISLILRFLIDSAIRYFVAGFLAVLVIVFLRGFNKPASEIFELTNFNISIILSAIIWVLLFTLFSRIKGNRSEPSNED